MPFTEDNPFVSDPLYFENKPHYVYSETTWYQAQQIYNGICFPVGILLFSLVCYLLCSHTSDILKSYRKMLLLATMVDLLVLINCLGIRFRFRFKNGMSISTLEGIFTSVFPRSFMCPIMRLYLQISCIEVSILPVQYFYRYYTVKKDKPPSTLKIIIVLCLIETPCIIVASITTTMFCQSSNPNGTDFGPLWFEEVPIPPLYVTLFAEKSILLYLNTILITVYYLISILFGILTIRDLRLKFNMIMYNEAAKSVERQVTKTMIAQAILPLIVLVTPQFLTQLTINTLSNEYIAMLTKQSITLVPIFNMLATVVFIKPYRNFCLGFVPCSRRYRYSCIKYSASVSTTAPTNPDVH